GDTQAVSRFRSGCLALDAASRLTVDSRADCAQRADETDVSRQRPPMTVTGGDVTGWREAMSGRRYLALVATAMLITTLVPAPVLGASTERVHVLIRFTTSPTAADVAGLKGLGADVTRRFRIVPAVAATVPEAALAAISRNPRIAVVEPDSLLYALEYRSTHDWGVARVRADEVHETGNLGAEVRVAVIDSGIDCDHVELMAFGHCEHFWNYVANSDDADDDYGHGTHVAGTIVASLHGTPAGVVGVAPEATVVAYKTLDADGVGAWSRTIAAIDDIVSDGTIDIVNLSIGRGDYSSTAEFAMQRAYEAGILLVAAAGNSGNCRGMNDSVSYPALFASVIAVAAIDSVNQRPCWSSTGDAVELSAPGVSVFSTWPSDMSVSHLDPQPVCEDLDGDGEDDTCYYKFGSGTSMSAPHVAGVAALVLAADLLDDDVLNDDDGDYGVANELRLRLAATAFDLGTPGRDPQYGYGLVNAVAASASVGITLTASAYKVRRVQYVDLVWSGADGSEVRVYRDSVVVTTTANDGFYTDRIGPVSGGTYGYKICETETLECSQEVLVTF
ncbi:MAG: S8 family serine peptidase, partial [Chloroflexota bacterium]